MSVKDKDGNALINKKEVAKIMDMYDKDGNRELDFEEFTNMIRENI